MRIRTIAMSVAILGITLVAPVGAAQAALNQCTGSKMCVWGNNDFAWLLAAENHNQGVKDVFHDASGEDNEADSWQNRSPTYNGCLYNASNGSCPLANMPLQDKDDNMFVLDADRTSSMRTNAGC